MAKINGINVAQPKSRGTGSADTAFSVLPPTGTSPLFRVSGDGGTTISGALTLTTKLADSEISSSAIWNGKIGGSITSGQVAFGTAAGVIGGDAGLTWDNVNKRLGVGTSTPSFPLDVVGQSRFSSNINLGTTNNANGVRIIFNNSLAGRNFQIANNWNVGNTFEITPSTTVNGTVFTTPALAINGNSGNVGIGTTSPTARLHVQAPGALSTDVAFRIRNSADTGNIASITGNGVLNLAYLADTSRIAINSTTSGQAAIAIGSGNSGLRTVSVGYNNDAAGQNGVVIGQGNLAAAQGACGIIVGYNNNHQNGTVVGKSNTGVGSLIFGNSNAIGGTGPTNSNVIAIGSGMTETSGNAKMPHTFMFGSYATTGNKAGLSFKSNNLNHLLLGYDIMSASYSNTTGTNWIGIANGTAPSGAIDAFQQYSADITAGNAAPHFRTENGSVIKLYQQSAVTSSQGIADALTNLGFLTGSSVIPNSSAFPFTGSALITGSLDVTGLLTVTGNVGIGTTSPDGTSILDLTSTTQGFLPPRMREFQRDDIVSPAAGLMVYNTDTDEINVYTNNNGWRILAYV